MPAKLTIDLSATSAQWKAIDGATGDLVTPLGGGATPGTVKFAASGTTADYTINGSSFSAIKNLSTTKPVSVAALNKLKALCLFPHIDAAATFNGDGLYLNLTIGTTHPWRQPGRRCDSWRVLSQLARRSLMQRPR